MVKKEMEEFTGKVIEKLPNTTFRIAVEGTNEQVLGYLSGKMRKFKIRIGLGDTVSLIKDPTGGKARITKRH